MAVKEPLSSELFIRFEEITRGGLFFWYNTIMPFNLLFFALIFNLRLCLSILSTASIHVHWGNIVFLLSAYFIPFACKSNMSYKSYTSLLAYKPSIQEITASSDLIVIFLKRKSPFYMIAKGLIYSPVGTSSHSCGTLGNHPFQWVVTSDFHPPSLHPKVSLIPHLPPLCKNPKMITT